MRFVLLHYHFFKNAGTTIEEILAHSFGNFARIDGPGREGDIPPGELLEFLNRHPSLVALSSHHFHYPVPEAAGFHFFDICFLRDPLDRLRSIYDYFCQKPDPGDPMSDLANLYGLGEFAERALERFPQYVNDPQVSLLANGGWSGPPRRADLDQAIETMRNISFLGVVDRFNRSLVAGEYLLRPLFPNLNFAQPPANVSAEPGEGLEERLNRLRRSCRPRVYDELLRLNALDYELLDQARAEVELRFQLVPDGEARLQNLERMLLHLEGAQECAVCLNA
ncbi:MAG TPA: hypothetical protein VFW83_10660 [Bryobacteraceae bacterium]|nr:hypothetical protein [Bryobacteraceae bacterium]